MLGTCDSRSPTAPAAGRASVVILTMLAILASGSPGRAASKPSLTAQDPQAGAILVQSPQAQAFAAQSLPAKAGTTLARNLQVSASLPVSPRSRGGDGLTVPPRSEPATSRLVDTGSGRLSDGSKIWARNLDVPWGLAFLPGGGVLLSGRDNAKIIVVHGDGSRSLARNVRGVVPNGASGGEGGLLGLALSPNFRHDHWVYAYVSAATDNRIIRMKFHNQRLGRQRLVLSGIPRSLHHNGGRIAFGPDGMLYATTGDAERSAAAQKPRTLGGKILRLTPRGGPAPGNPFRGSVVYSYGHRNVEGLDWDSKGRLWATEFGENTWDELNLIRPGHNYGWPIIEGRSSQRRFTNPKAVWHTAEAGPSGIAIARTGGATVAFIGGLTGQRLWRVRLDGSRVVGRRDLLVGALGRIRSTAVARGYLWLTTSNTDGRATARKGDDRLLRMRIH